MMIDMKRIRPRYPEFSNIGLVQNCYVSIPYLDLDKDEIYNRFKKKRKQIRIGPKFQAEVPAEPSYPMKEDYEEKAGELIWNPAQELSLRYVESRFLLSDRGKQNVMQLLHQSNYNLETVSHVLSISPEICFEKPTDGWTPHEERLFHSSLMDFSCGKDFRKIQQLIKTKTLPQIIDYYYQIKNQNFLKIKNIIEPTTRRHFEDRETNERFQISEDEDNNLEPLYYDVSIWVGFEEYPNKFMYKNQKTLQQNHNPRSLLQELTDS